MQLLRFAVGTRPRSQRSHSYQGDRQLWCLEDFGSFRVLSIVRFTKFHQVSFIKSLTRERPDCQRPLCSDPPDKVHKLPIASTSWSIVPPQYSEMLSEWNRDWAKLALGILRQSNLSIALQAMARLTLALLTSLTVERGLKWLKCKATGRNIAYKENPQLYIYQFFLRPEIQRRTS